VTLTGSNNANLTGNSYNNILTGNLGDNILKGGAGNDLLDGGEGKDTVVFSGAHSEYKITKHEGQVTVVDEKQNRDGTETLINIEILKFSDKTVEL
jgi:Ca2+-binding RTX toxin-like protein